MPASSHAQAKRVVRSVLEYLSGMEKLATISRDRRATLHFEECWELAWRAYYGGYSLPTSGRITYRRAPAQPVPASKPPWMIAKYARPVRKVVARVEECVSLSRRGPAVRVSYDILECGHKVEGNESYGAGQPARHRRCWQCIATKGAREEEHGEGYNRRAKDAQASYMG